MPAPPSQAATPALGLEDKGPAPSPPRPSEADVDDALDAAARPPSPPPGPEEVEAAPLRAVSPICTKGLAPKHPATGEPVFDRANPAELLVEAAYQRELSDRSIRLIRSIVEGWDWRRFKPPVVALVEQGGLLIDGQHTAIAAASHPHIDQIPIMIVDAPELVTRALAFIGHNRDRLPVSTMQLHHAAVAAGDVTASAVERICQKAGVTLVRNAFGGYHWKVGDSVAISAIAGLLGRVGERRAVDLLHALVLARLAPVAANDIKAAEMLFTHADYAEQLHPLPDGGIDLAQAIIALGDTAAREAKLFAAAQCVPLWRALAVIWFRKTKKRRKT